MDDTTTRSPLAYLSPEALLRHFVSPSPDTPNLQDNHDLDRSHIEEIADRVTFTVDRNADLAEYYLTDTPVYFQHTRELEDLIDSYENAVASNGSFENTLLHGPVGSGKETLARAVASHLDIPFAKVRGDSLTLATLLGRPQLDAVDTLDEPIPWTDSDFMQLLYAAQSTPAIVYIENPSQLSTELKSLFYQAITPNVTQKTMSDSQFEDPTTELEAADPSKLIVIGSEDPGQTYPMAERARYFPLRIELDYIGLKHPEKEQELLMNHAPISADAAMALVDAANTVREMARDETNLIPCPISVPELLNWAKTSAVYAERDSETPVMDAAASVLLNALTQTNSESAALEAVLRQKTDDITLDEFHI